MLTTILLNPITAILYLVHLGINITLLLLLIQLILTWRRFAWLAPFGEAGKPITDAMTGAVATRLEGGFCSRKLSQRGKLSVCIAILTLADLCLNVVFRSI